jgi:hypothetical protein
MAADHRHHVVQIRPCLRIHGHNLPRCAHGAILESVKADQTRIDFDVAEEGHERDTRRVGFPRTPEVDCG